MRTAEVTHKSTSETMRGGGYEGTTLGDYREKWKTAEKNANENAKDARGTIKKNVYLKVQARVGHREVSKKNFSE